MSTELLPGLNVSRETEERLSALRDLVIKWSKAINLVAPQTIDDIWNRHILDSAQLALHAPLLNPDWVDLGSGGGFPGLVIAILRRELEVAGMTLVESDRRKSTFLRTAIRELDLQARVEAERIEDLPPANASVLSARALAPLPKLLEMASRHLAANGRAMFLKGATRQDEISTARRDWHFELTERRSMTQPEAAVLIVERIARV
ncbi:16S rRNA (guanine(527)-N(7))-methyltransferase RsmG [Histidinibacterium aquaticum]|uniref:Ribosomal RNA small subunit methyltransferase G n=1 Tax=Histidinibacterium aquaticum TaxID=2613962 RepID=A0A5J5GGG5_9RHOB|nr:16S rRNA (guanine(527)-N(7))-methyltransferase RsmG [Histidinibacterium aquaticum]KAA9006828.1 16S rRNA (guanine(527)-N(7))-methyltransferase RsmG [Histidinibacterium aquaticum]